MTTTKITHYGRLNTATIRECSGKKALAKAMILAYIDQRSGMDWVFNLANIVNETGIAENTVKRYLRELECEDKVLRRIPAAQYSKEMRSNMVYYELDKTAYENRFWTERDENGATAGPIPLEKGAAVGPITSQKRSTAGPIFSQKGATSGPIQYEKGSMAAPIVSNKGGNEWPDKGSTAAPQGVNQWPDKGATAAPIYIREERRVKTQTHTQSGGGCVSVCVQSPSPTNLTGEEEVGEVNAFNEVTKGNEVTKLLDSPHPFTKPVFVSIGTADFTPALSSPSPSPKEQFDALAQKFKSPFEEKEPDFNLPAIEKVEVLRSGLESLRKTGQITEDDDALYPVTIICNKRALEMAEAFFELNPGVSVRNILQMIWLCNQAAYENPAPESGYDVHFNERRAGANVSFFFKFLRDVNAALPTSFQLPPDTKYAEEEALATSK